MNMFQAAAGEGGRKPLVSVKAGKMTTKSKEGGGETIVVTPVETKGEVILVKVS
jgi:hypothetical protein